ncbi:MAG: cobalamin-binding protein [Armatimonadetes bacterium]|nr:cobalamin-binding protein [Armatimonadota bacterium]
MTCSDGGPDGAPRHAAPPTALAALALLACVTGCRTSTSDAPAPAPAKTSPWPRTFTDAEQASTTLEAPPQRIASLSPAITEMVFVLEAGGRLVGVTEYCDYPPQAKQLPTVGAYTGFSLERVLSLKPDLVLGMRGTAKEAISGLRQAGVPVLVYDPVSVGDVLDLMDLLAGIVGDEGAGNEAVRQLRARVEGVQAEAAQLPRRPRVLCAVQIEPLFAAGPDNHIDDMIRLAGGENAAGDADVPWPQYSLERMLQKDPEVILVPQGYMGDAEGEAQKTLRSSKAWSGTTAVKRGAVVEIPDDLITLPGPRIVEGLGMMAKAVRDAATAEASEADESARQ